MFVPAGQQDKLILSPLSYLNFNVIILFNLTIQILFHYLT